MTLLSTNPTPRQLSLGLAALRIVLGIVLIAHGVQKLFQFGIGGTTEFFTQVGAPLPAVTAPLVAGLEFFGGIALVLGLLTRLVSVGVVFDMLGALFLVHIGNGFFASGNGIELVLMLAAAALALVFTGAGELSADHAIARRRATR